ncbi:MAG: precorrin-3B C(17)-methyltransferase [Lachnospiraceae bacterium]|nr:precorrin-3B C(17)-methyltransferase [Lachnospiraceae bacterium]
MAKKIWVVGLGPGSREMMTGQAKKALEACSVIVGYHVYIDLVKEDYPDKRLLSTPMKREEERCKIALEEAGKGEDVAFVCSGDPGVYGMAGLLLEMAKDFPEVDIQVLPGITAACSGAAVLGAPLIHDFCLISLSDLLTPWETIEKRLRLAAEAGFIMAIYNPSSHKRHDYLQKACDILLTILPGETVCGTVQNIGREGEEGKTMSLLELRDTSVDMFTTVFIGNSTTKALNGKMITPRGYQTEKAD